MQSGHICHRERCSGGEVLTTALLQAASGMTAGGRGQLCRLETEEGKLRSWVEGGWGSWSGSAPSVMQSAGSSPSSGPREAAAQLATHLDESLASRSHSSTSSPRAPPAGP